MIRAFIATILLSILLASPCCPVEFKATGTIGSYFSPNHFLVLHFYPAVLYQFFFYH